MSNYELYPNEIIQICENMETSLHEYTRSISRAIGHNKDYQKVDKFPDLVEMAYQNVENTFIRFKPILGLWEDLNLFMNWNDVPTYKDVTCYRDLIILNEQRALPILPSGERNPIYEEINGYFTDINTVLNKARQQTEIVVITNAQDVEKIRNHGVSKVLKPNWVNRKKLEEKKQCANENPNIGSDGPPTQIKSSDPGELVIKISDFLRIVDPKSKRSIQNEAWRKNLSLDPSKPADKIGKAHHYNLHDLYADYKEKVNPSIDTPLTEFKIYC